MQVDQKLQQSRHLSVGDGLAIAGIWLAYAIVYAAVIVENKVFTEFFFDLVGIVGFVTAWFLTHKVLSQARDD